MMVIDLTAQLAPVLYGMLAILIVSAVALLGSAVFATQRHRAAAKGKAWVVTPARPLAARLRVQREALQNAA